MYAFDAPWALALLALPLVGRLLPAYREGRAALRVPFFQRLVDVSGTEPERGAALSRRGVARAALAALAWGLLVVALAQPVWIGDPIVRQSAGRDLLLVVDLSGSMDVRDFEAPDGTRIDRLTALKHVVAEFIAQRRGDRVGLVLFGSAPFLQVPFTEDLAIAQTLLDEAQVRMAGPQTRLGDAIGLGIQLFESSETPERVMLVLTDGNDTRSLVPPAQAARIAADDGITIHAIGVGDPSAAGEDPLDEEALRDVASATGGSYFHASDRAELAEIADRIAALAPAEFETQSVRPRTPLFPYPLAGFALAALLPALLPGGGKPPREMSRD